MFASSSMLFLATCKLCQRHAGYPTLSGLREVKFSEGEIARRLDLEAMFLPGVEDGGRRLQSLIHKSQHRNRGHDSLPEPIVESSISILHRCSATFRRACFVLEVPSLIADRLLLALRSRIYFKLRTPKAPRVRNGAPLMLHRPVRRA